MKPKQPYSTIVSACALALLCFLIAPHAHSAGVTVITHGFSGNADGWVLGMAERIKFYPTFPGTNVICYEITVADTGNITSTVRKVSGPSPIDDPTAEIVIKLDWGTLAGFFAQYDTYEVAAAVVPHFFQTNFIPELGARALAELPLHLVGHSRGGSLVCEMARLFGMRGLWVDHITTLDPHPVNEDGNMDPLSVIDAPLRIYDNVLFADNYYQDFGGYPFGQLIPSSYNRRFTSLPGGYTSAHSDTHLWYHATIDMRSPASDTETLLSAADRALWFSAYELTGTRAGFHYSLLGGGDRMSTNQPIPSAGERPVMGLNQRWNFGAGEVNNRTPLPSNNGAWPNLIRFNLAGTNFMAQGSTNTVTLYAQWAQPDTGSGTATISIHLDNDLNPYNGNEQLLQTAQLSGTTSNQIAVGAVSFNVASTNSTVGQHTIYGKVTEGTRSRYLYAPEPLTIISSAEAPQLGISQSPSSIQVSVTGVAGQRILLEATSDFSTWSPLATNWLTEPLWTYTEPPGPHRFYRASIR